MNQVDLVGKLIEEPERSITSSGNKLSKFKISLEKSNKDGETAQEIFEIVAFRDLAEIEMDVGQFIVVNGRLNANNYEKDGKTYYNCSILANNLSVI